MTLYGHSLKILDMALLSQPKGTFSSHHKSEAVLVKAPALQSFVLHFEFFQDRIPRQNYNPLNSFLGNYAKKCGKVAQENVGCWFSKSFVFYKPWSFRSAACSRSNLHRIDVTQLVTVLYVTSRNGNHLSLSKPFSHTLLRLIFYHLVTNAL